MKILLALTLLILANLWDAFFKNQKDYLSAREGWQYQNLEAIYVENFKDKIEEMQIVKNVKGTASAAVNDIKEIAKDTKDAAGGALDQVQKSAKEVLHKVEKKLG